VSTEWFDYCIRNNKLPGANAHLLVDRVEEDKLGFKLEDAIERARKNNRKLLRGWQIFLTEGIVGGWQTYKDIIQANGGMCNLYKGRASMTATKRTFPRETQEEEAVAENQGSDCGDTLYLISGETSKDMELWPKFRELAEKEDMVPKIVNTNWLLNVAMGQRIVEPGKEELDVD
jgi:hypothetical protein